MTSPDQENTATDSESKDKKNDTNSDISPITTKKPPETAKETIEEPPITLETDQSIDNLIKLLLKVGNKPLLLPALIKESHLFALCHRSRKILMQQNVCLQLQPPITIAGDVHGQYVDLLNMFIKVGFPSKRAFLFMGDYVDRGPQQIEVMALLLAYKCRYPTSFFILRGNHEAASCNLNPRYRNFYDECRFRYTPQLFAEFQTVFDCLPYTAIVGGKILCMHGGLSPDLKTLEQLNNIKRPFEPPDSGIACDLIWADPSAEKSGWHVNHSRGVSYQFGVDVVKEFCSKHGIELIARAHQMVSDGYQFFADRRLVTIFSAPLYNNQQFDNKAAIMHVTDELFCTFTVWEGEKPDTNNKTDNKTKIRSLLVGEGYVNVNLVESKTFLIQRAIAFNNGEWSWLF